MINPQATAGLLLALKLLAPGAGLADDAPGPSTPNIVFILADDLGYGDIEAFGGEHCNIDNTPFRLALRRRDEVHGRSRDELGLCAEPDLDHDRAVCLPLRT